MIVSRCVLYLLLFPAIAVAGSSAMFSEVRVIVTPATFGDDESLASRPINVTFEVKNRTDGVIRLPTRCYGPSLLSTPEIPMQLKIDWRLPTTSRGEFVRLPEADIGIVELLPNEVTTLIVKIPYPRAMLGKPLRVVFEISEEFGSLGVQIGQWVGRVEQFDFSHDTDFTCKKLESSAQQTP